VGLPFCVYGRYSFGKIMQDENIVLLQFFLKCPAIEIGFMC